VCSLQWHSRATIDQNIGGNARAFTFVPIKYARIIELEFSNSCTREIK